MESIGFQLIFNYSNLFKIVVERIVTTERFNGDKRQMMLNGAHRKNIIQIHSFILRHEVTFHMKSVD